MSEYAGLEFQLCLSRRHPTEEWLRALFQRLWTHGYSFSATSSATWEAELEAPGCAFVLGDGDMDTGALTTFIARAPVESYSLVNVSNGVSSLQLNFIEMANTPDDASSDLAGGSVARLSYVALWTKKRDTSPPGQSDRPYHHAYNAFVHTCALLCEALDPGYGIGYDLTHVRDQAGQDAIASLDTSVAPDLLAGRLPNASAWFRREPLQYIAPAFVTPERTLTWLSSPGISLQRLATGGLFIVPTFSPYTPEDSIAYGLLARGKRLSLLVAQGRHGAASASTYEQLAQAQREGMEVLTRATTIFASVNNREGENEARFERSQLEN